MDAKASIVFALSLLIALSVLLKGAGEVRTYEVRLDDHSQIRELELKKAVEINKYRTKRYEQLRDIHPPHNKDVMEAELMMRLSEIDVEIARIMCE